jgi:uncharacterized protein (TIGR02145 family)
MLIETAGGFEAALGRLRSKSGWNLCYDVRIDGWVRCDTANGTDDFGFSALPGGGRTGTFHFRIGTQAYWWSATVRNTVTMNDAIVWHMIPEGGTVQHYAQPVSYAYPVRCVADVRP